MIRGLVLRNTPYGCERGPARVQRIADIDGYGAVARVRPIAHPTRWVDAEVHQ